MPPLVLLGTTAVRWGLSQGAVVAHVVLTWRAPAGQHHTSTRGTIHCFDGRVAKQQTRRITTGRTTWFGIGEPGWYDFRVTLTDIPCTIQFQSVHLANRRFTHITSAELSNAPPIRFPPFPPPQLPKDLTSVATDTDGLLDIGESPLPTDDGIMVEVKIEKLLSGLSGYISHTWLEYIKHRFTGDILEGYDTPSTLEPMDDATMAQLLDDVSQEVVVVTSHPVAAPPPLPVPNDPLDLEIVEITSTESAAAPSSPRVPTPQGFDDGDDSSEEVFSDDDNTFKKPSSSRSHRYPNRKK